MSEELSFRAEAATEYDRAYSHVSGHFLPFLLQAARLTQGMKVSDVATGTGIAAEAILGIVGPEGEVFATDISPEMVEQARRRLAGYENATVAVQDGQGLTAPTGAFDAVICSMGLMFFPDPGRALDSFHRVLRSGGYAAVSVLTTADKSYNGRINVAIARHVPAVAEAIARTFALGNAGQLEALFRDAQFVNIDAQTEKRSFMLPSFDSYYGPFERGGGSTGQLLLSLSEGTRHEVREEIRRELADAGGPVEIEVKIKIVSGQRQ